MTQSRVQKSPYHQLLKYFDFLKSSFYVRMIDLYRLNRTLYKKIFKSIDFKLCLF